MLAKTAETVEVLPPPGHNKPPLAEVLKDSTQALTADIEALAQRANTTPRKVVTQADLEKIGRLVLDARALNGRIETTRQTEKAPFLEGGRTVDGFFAILSERVERIASTFQAVADDFQRARIAEARRKAEEDAQKARDEQKRQADLAAKAAAANRPKTAEKHEARADAAAERATAVEFVSIAKPADIARTRTASGLLATAKGTWVFEITDYDGIALDKLRPYLKREHIEAAIRLAVRQGVREIGGVHIFQDTKADFR